MTPVTKSAAKARAVEASAASSTVRFGADDVREMRAALLIWYEAHKRDLPWRATRDPYRIWVSEIMLQQTRVAAVLEDRKSVV